MQQYSAENGQMTPWHMAYLGGILIRGNCYILEFSVFIREIMGILGPGLTFVEGSAVTATGRITPEDLGLWDDSQIASHQEVVQFAHSQGQKIGIQVYLIHLLLECN